MDGGALKTSKKQSFDGGQGRGTDLYVEEDALTLFLLFWAQQRRRRGYTIATQKVIRLFS